MKTTHTRDLMFAAGLVGALALTVTLARATDVLPSWNDGAPPTPA